MDRCPACDHNCKLVQPTGPTNSNVLLLGEKPGVTEDRFGRCFVGDTGKELDRLYLPLAGLDRRDVRITNSVKCRLGDSNAKPTPTQIDACARYWLPTEIAECSPSVIVLLGATACSLIPDIELDKQHGLPILYDGSSPQYFGDWQGWLYPCYHPAAGLHQTSLMISLIDDFRRLRLWLRGLWEPPISDIVTDYSLAETIFDIDRAFEGGVAYKHVPIDTESDGDRPWSLQFSLRAGHGCMIRADKPTLIKRFATLIDGYGLMLHHSIADLEPLESMGVPTTGRSIRDTMIEAYELGNLPQGLKALAYRQLGLKMRSWEDVVMPPSRRKMVEWLTNEWIEEGELKIRVETQLKTKLKISYKPTERERALKRILSHSHKPTYDLWLKSSEAGLAGYPIPSIAHAELRDAITYSNQDADATGRIGTWLEGERARITKEEWMVEDGDVDL